MTRHAVSPSKSAAAKRAATVLAGWPQRDLVRLSLVTCPPPKRRPTTVTRDHWNR